MSRKIGTLAGLALALIVTGCSSSSPSSSGPPSTSSDTSHSQILKTYFEAFATDKATTMEAMLTASAKDSPANAYAQFQIDQSMAYSSANMPPEPSTVTVSGETVTMVDKLPANPTDAERADATTVFKDFQFSSEGLIQTWTAVPGGPLAERVHEQTATVNDSGISIVLGQSYLTNSDDLRITLGVNNQSSQPASVTVQGYIGPDGRQVEVESTPAELTPGAGAVATAILTITEGKAGGQLIVVVNGQTENRLKVV